VALLERFSQEDRQRIRAVLTVIISGQELDLTRFAAASPPRVIALDTDAELDDYTYLVAGCVGEFWTRTCRAHLFPGSPLDEQWLLANGVRFGKGLQLVNILRDLPQDLRKGRCYLPREALTGAGLDPADLLRASSQAALRPIYDAYLDRARNHLQAGWNYTNALPIGQCRLRLACAWPILIGAKTLAKLRRQDFLDATRPIKVSRREVRGVLARTLLLYFWPPAWKAQFAKQTNGRE
jgi:farnesyl-diphosphate farnesyltransferase